MTIFEPLKPLVNALTSIKFQVFQSLRGKDTPTKLPCKIKRSKSQLFKGYVNIKFVIFKLYPSPMFHFERKKNRGKLTFGDLRTEVKGGKSDVD